MNFLSSRLAILAAPLLIVACGGGIEQASPEPAAEEKTVEKPVVTAEVSTAEGPGALFTSLPAPYNTADEARGRRTYKLCQSCHTLAEGGQNLVGPNLYGVFGREIGAVENFSYSRAVQDSDIVWTPELLDNWLENPRTFLPGNRMSFAGVRRPEDRLAVIAYIMAETGYPASTE